MWLPLLVLLGLIFLYRRYRYGLILKNLTDKYVFITGCDSGFGNLLARQLDKRGVKVLAGCLTKKGAEDLKKETSSRVQTVTLDVTNTQSVVAAVKWASDIVGDKGIWGIVNNAGISIPSSMNEWMTKEDFFKIINVNLLGVVDVTIHFLPLIRKARGRVINIASIAGRLTVSPGGYCLSKYGVESFSDTLRREMKPFGVKVCIIEPGFFNTQITNSEVLRKSLKYSWDNTSEEVKKSYGEKFFQQSMESLDQMSSLCNTDLSLVTNCMEHALTAVYPWTRYSVGWDATLFYLPLSYLPTVISDFILSIGIPRPADAI
ncbi:retinol dehydrogenase 7-like [Bufo gargarizans]|uniref:retinol dehydrogenase 7-like n=1 Tax=Bufo gargarizans TaxID=30331 RepID=UPI001CF58BA2|nr:retinol dehydrogenase 7-like [Bufo gargarizans]XP_044142301.1 retinol dehydrogenase 7-like [Bufo gargarizans]